MSFALCESHHVSRPLIVCPVGEGERREGRATPRENPVDYDGADLELAALDDPVVGKRQMGSHDLQVKKVKGLPSPREPSAAEVEEHDRHHVKFESWCPFCVSCRKPNNHHRCSKKF